jgi:hypothetical protein
MTSLERHGTMETTRPPPASPINACIAGFAPELRALRQQVRQTVRQAAPDAQETLSYRIPAFRQNGMRVRVTPLLLPLGFSALWL